MAADPVSTPETFVHTGPFDAAMWVNGARVRFADAGAVTDKVRHPDAEPVIVEGIVNGPAVDLPGGWLVPCWTERDGREATTIYVASDNVVGVILPAPYSPAADRKRGPDR